jgi:hypothetical protein
MNEGVKILIERLKTNPEDFSYDINMGLSSKWSNLLNMVLNSEDFTSEEKDAIKKELREKHRNSFTARVMQALLVEDEASDEGKSLLMGRHPIQGTAMGGQTLAPSLAVPNGGTGATWWTTTTNSLEQAILQQRQALDTALKLKVFDDPPPKRKSIIREYWEIIKDFKNI